MRLQVVYIQALELPRLLELNPRQGIFDAEEQRLLKGLFGGLRVRDN